MSIFDSILSKPVFFENLNHIFDFQINDLRRGLELAKANFLVAVGCMNTIEFLGGLRNGELGSPRGKSELRFKEGVRLLGENYGVRFLFPEMASADEEVMWEIRCGLTLSKTTFFDPPLTTYFDPPG